MSADIPIWHLGGDGATTLNLAVANGFPPATYAPLVAHLSARFRVVTLPPRPLWPTNEQPPQDRRDWRHTIARDLIDGIRAHDLRDLVAVGHSFGAVATIVAANAMPERFKAVVLLDPTILPQAALWFIRAVRWTGRDLGNRLAQGADRRRDHFEGREAAYERLRQKALFRDWHEDAFRGYIDSLQPDPSRGGLTLAWPRRWEAHYFRTIYTGIWRELPRLPHDIPTMMIRGGTSDTLLPSAACRIQRIMPRLIYHEIAGHGHLFPQSAPDETARLILDWSALAESR